MSSNQQTPITITGPAGKIEAMLHLPDSGIISAVAIVCHPHPLYDGTMNNKVVTTLVRVFSELGLSTVRFNFRGVGNSEGEYAKTIGETDDLMAVVKWVENEFLNKALWLSGFSFGAYVAANAAARVQAKQLVLIAPPVHHFDFAVIPEFSCPWILVQGGQDEIVPTEQVLTWARSRQRLPTLIELPNAGHFFHGQLVLLKEKLLVMLEATD